MHTPGPWKADHHLVWADDRLNAPLAEPRGFTLEEVEANAKLIAAAPAMLAALEDCETTFRRFFERDFKGNEWQAAFKTSWAKARDTIEDAKA